MNVRWLPRILVIVALGLLIGFAPSPSPSFAGEGGTIPPAPVGSNYSTYELEAGLYALTLIY